MLGSDFMKIEKLNDNQIRCTLNKSDLASRQLKISELAYGSEKAKDLFRDMMQQASYEFGFEAEDIPLMIEAIPVSTDCIVLVITKVEDPEELDTRFSKFAPSISDDIDEMDLPYDMEETYDDTISSTDDDDDNGGADDVINLFNKVKDYLSTNKDGTSENTDSVDSNMQESTFIPFSKSLKDSTDTIHNQKKQAQTKSSKTEQSTPASNEVSEINVMKVYSFKRLSPLEHVSVIISAIYNGCNSLYKNDSEGDFYLVVNKSDCSPENFNKTCNILSEYGARYHNSYASDVFFEEHYQTIIKDKALQVLSKM